MSSVAVTACGQGLSLNQRLAVSNAIKNLKLNEQLQDISFWGKIAGKERDYLIAQSVAVSTKIAKQHFFSHDDGLTFAKLPDLDAFIIEQAPLHKGRFTGNPSLKLRDPTKTSNPDDPDFEEDEEEEEYYEDEDGERRVPDRRLTEMERLAFAVNRIEHDTCVTPLGAWVMTATGAISKNFAFSGLDHAAAAKLASYGLFRAPALERTLATIHKMGVANCPDFLDSLAEQKPEGAWALVPTAAGDAVALRSLAWPGFEFKLTVGEPIGQGWSRAYFGTGEPNEDLAFML
jgi:hypothetical protein